jgi:PAS domain S-box-containing protein
MMPSSSNDGGTNSESLHDLQIRMQREIDAVKRELQERTQQLAHTGALLTATLEATADAVFAIDLRGDISVCNQKAIELLAIPDSVLAAATSAALCEHIAQLVVDSMSFKERLHVLRETVDQSSRDLIELKDGRFIERFVQPQFMNGTLVGSIVNYRDVTVQHTAEVTARTVSLRMQALLHEAEQSRLVLLSVVENQKRVESELAEKQKLLQNITTMVPDKVYLHSYPLAQQIFTNRELDELLGYTAAELVEASGDLMATSIHPDDADRVQHHKAAMRELGNGETLQIEYRVKARTGEYLWLFVREQVYKRDACGKVEVIFGICQNITERKRVELDLKESEERFRQIADNIREVFWILDIRARRVIYVSPAYELIWGRGVNALYQNPRNWLEAVHTDDQARVAQAMENVVISGRYRETYRVVRPNGSIRWILDQAYPVMGTDGNISRLVGTAEDITESRELEQQLRQSQKLEAVGTLAGGIAHDFNNILASVIGFTQLARQAAPDNRELREYLDHIAGGSQRAAELVKQILTFSRTSSPDLSVLNLDNLVREASKLLRAAIPTSIKIDVEISSDLPPVLANATQLHQVIMNLGTNAWHAMRDQPGRLAISVDTCALDDTQAHLTGATTGGKYVRLTVKDSGRGMDAETQKRLFEPFFTTKAAGEGTGLGLSVVHGIVRAHQGIIRVTSAINQGSTFEICLPAQTKLLAVVDSSQSKPVLLGNGEHILFVDDEPALAQLGARMLIRLGYKVTAFTQVLQALARIEHEPNEFQLVITDQSMPGLTGSEFAARIHKIRPDLPVILASGYAAALTPAHLKTVGIRKLLNKPYSEAELMTAIQSHLQSSHIETPVDRITIRPINT